MCDEVAERRLACQTLQGFRGEVASKPRPYCLGARVLCWVLRSPHSQELGAHQEADESHLSRKDVTFCRVTTSEMPQSFESPCSRVRLPLGSTATASVMSLALKT